MGGACRVASHVLDESGQDRRALNGQKDHLHSIGVGRAANVTALSVERLTGLRIELGDVVREDEAVVFRDANPSDVDACWRASLSMDHLAVPGGLDDLGVLVELEEVLPRLLVGVVGQTGQRHVRADHASVTRWIHHRMKGHHIFEAMLRLLD